MSKEKSANESAVTNFSSPKPSPVKYYLAERAHHEILKRVDTEIQELRRHGKHETAAVVKDMAGMIRDVLAKHLDDDEKKTVPPDSNKSLGNRERTTLLTIIAALAKEAKIDISHPSKAAPLIENSTELIGCRVAARTIEEHLKRIPDALENRAK